MPAHPLVESAPPSPAELPVAEPAWLEPPAAIAEPIEREALAPLVGAEALSPTGPAEAATPAVRDPAADYAEGLKAGAGSQLVAGPPMSVDAPLPAQRMNTFFGVGAVILLILTVIVVILLAIFVINLLKPR
jgi:hypothetical protein